MHTLVLEPHSYSRSKLAIARIDPSVYPSYLQSLALLLTLILSCLSVLASPICARQSTRDKAFLPTLTTAYAVHTLTTAEAQRQYPVHLRAVVTYFDQYIVPTMPLIFVCDPTGCIFLFASPPLPPLHTGALVEIHGVSGPGDYAPVVNKSVLRILGDSPFPVSPHRIGRNEMITGHEDAQWVEVEGMVRSLVRSETNATIDLTTNQGTVTATTVKKTGVDYNRLIGARILLRANSPFS